MAESTVSSVVKYLGGLLVEETTFLGGVVDQIDNIHDEMVQMQCFLRDADSRQHESESVRNLVADIRDLAYNAEDIIESYILKAKYASSFNPKKCIRLHQIGNEIEKLQSKIQAIARRVTTYNFIRFDQGEGTSSTSERQRQLRQSYPHNDDEDVVGIQDYIELLVAKLINKEGPHLVSIVGMGGLGKTTIATKVYNHKDVKRHFDCCSWSCISQQFQVRTILQGIIRNACNPNEETRLETLSDRELTLKLFNLLEGKCYLVVLDDIWSTEAWDVLKSAFPKGRMGSKIMLTTRIRNVALHVDPIGFLLEPVCLTNEQSWELFCKKAFPWKNVASTSSFSLYIPEAEAYQKKEKLGRDMIKKCGGLPLAIAVLGGLLATKQSIREWEMVAKDIGRYLNKAQQLQKEQHGVSWILSLSYHDLPSYLKPCFLYLGLYPEDTKVHKRELIHMWIAEGFVQHDGQGITKEEIGEEYLVELINRSMVQVDERSFRGKVKKCRLHDLIRDLCLEMAKEENCFCTFDVESSTGTIAVESISNNNRMRRYAIHNVAWDNRYVSMQQLPSRSPHLRALFLGNRNSHDSITMPLKFACKNFNFLRVLKLDNVKIDSLPRAIGKLIHLRYLRVILKDLRGSIKVPATIGNLRSLQFLVLQGCVSFPNVLWKMEQLRYCRVRGLRAFRILGWSFPLRLDGLKNLMTLELRVPWRMLPAVAVENDVQILTSLRKLFLCGLNRYNWKLLHQLLIHTSDRLQCLGLRFLKKIPNDFDWSPLSSCRTLQKLYLEGNIPKLPKLEDFPPNLTKLVLEFNDFDENPITTLETLPNLETLKISLYGYWYRYGYRYGYWYGYRSGYEPGTVTKFYFSAKGFGKLQYLRLQDLCSVAELEVEKGALACLVHLQISNCQALRRLPEGLRFLTSLKKLEVVGMPDEFQKRLREDGDDWHKIQHIPSIIVR